jgi:hypothetical protein
MAFSDRDSRRLDVRRNRGRFLRKTGPFFEFSLCLSRACLGELIVLK